MAVNADGTCQFTTARVACLRVGPGQYSVHYHGVFDKFPIPVIMPIANAPVAVDLLAFEAHGANTFSVVYRFADGADRSHTIISATGY
jgi:hypothetical protein